MPIIAEAASNKDDRRVLFVGLTHGEIDLLLSHSALRIDGSGTRLGMEILIVVEETEEAVIANLVGAGLMPADAFPRRFSGSDQALEWVRGQSSPASKEECT